MHTHRRSNKLNDICWMSRQGGRYTRRLLTTQRKPSPHTSPWKAHLHHHSLRHVRHTIRCLSKHTTASTWHSKFFTPTTPFSPTPQPASCMPHNTMPIKARYSFDMAQQVFYPNDPLQPGPMYFLTPRKPSSECVVKLFPGKLTT